MEALWTSIEMQAFIPLIFTLPIAVLYLAFEDTEQAAIVYQQIQSSPLLANSNFFKDIVDHYLPDVIIAKSQEKFDLQSDPKATLWDTASSILSSWMQLWMEEPEYSIKQSGA
jgi:hypothetical protein